MLYYFHGQCIINHENRCFVEDLVSVKVGERQEPTVNVAKPKKNKPEMMAKVENILLFTTPTCPNCKVVKAALDKAEISYVVVDAASHADLSRSYGIMTVPVLVTPSGRYEGVGAITQWARSVI